MLNLAGKKVLVTGGAGFIGSHLVDRLVLEAPASIVVVDNLFLGKVDNLTPARSAFPGLRFYQEDVTDYETMEAIVAREGIDVIFDLAVVPLPTSLSLPRWTVDTNVAATTVVCELARRNCYETLIHFSSSEVYGSAIEVPMDEGHPLQPATPYAASKAGGDHIVASYRQTFGIDAAVVRPFNAFGPRQNEGAYAGVIPVVLRRALANDPVLIDGDGHQTRDFTFVAEIAEAAVRVYQHQQTRGRVVNVCSGREVSINDLVASLLAAVGSSVEVAHGKPRPGDVRRHCGSPALCQQLTGFRPSGSLDAGLAVTVQWYRDLLSPGARMGGAAGGSLEVPVAALEVVRGN